MRILIVGDVHFSQYSSIIQSRGEFYSTRLENCIKSLIWTERLAEEQDCNTMVYLGDFFDHPTLDAEELTALMEIPWAPKISHLFLVGNHELKQDYNAAELLSLIPYGTVIGDKVISPAFQQEHLCMAFLPYKTPEKLEDDWQQVSLTLRKLKEDDPTLCTVVFAHSDLKGVQMGKFISTDGLDIQSIEESDCDKFFNGHLHNGVNISNKIINVGNLTGQNFSEDADVYKHRVVIFDTAAQRIEEFTNPFAFNFYKREIDLERFQTDLKYKKHCLECYQNNAVISVKCPEDIAADVADSLKNNPNVQTFRMVVIPKVVERTESNSKNTFQVDHIKQFADYVIDKLGSISPVLDVLQELQCI